MPRDISTLIRSSLEGPRDGEIFLTFLIIAHPDLSPSIYVVNDVATDAGATVTYQYAGNTYIAFPFDLELLTDGDASPVGRLTIQNVDRVLGEAVRALTTAPTVEFRMIPASEFDLTVNPRVGATGSPEEITPIYVATGLEMRGISVDAMSISGEVAAINDAQEPWPSIRATQARTPGLFR